MTQIGTAGRIVMIPGQIEEVNCPWEYPDEKAALRGLLSPGPAIRAIQHAGEAATHNAVLQALAPFKTASGGYRLRNKARYMITRTRQFGGDGQS